jgi:hypothetical protein
MSVVGKISVALLVSLLGGVAFAAADNESSNDISGQRRPRITVYPRPSYPGPYATRHCDSWLEKEFRVSGTVVVPRMRCYWR